MHSRKLSGMKAEIKLVVENNASGVVTKTEIIIRDLDERPVKKQFVYEKNEKDVKLTARGVTALLRTKRGGNMP